MDPRCFAIDLKYSKPEKRPHHVIDYNSIPTPSYFVFVNTMDLRDYVIYKVSYDADKTKPINPAKRLTPSKLRAYEELRPRNVIELAWKDNKRWIQVIPGTRQTIKDQKYTIIPFTTRKDIEDRIKDSGDRHGSKMFSREAAGHFMQKEIEIKKSIKRRKTGACEKEALPPFPE